jgi:hypothetical protein
MEYYIKSTVFWSTLSVYLGLMVVAIFLQAGSGDSDSPEAVALVLLGSVLAIALLIPHFLITAAYLKPEFIVGKLMGRISDGYLGSVAQRGAASVTGTSGDRLLPVLEIAERSIEKGDIATSSSAIASIMERFERSAVKPDELAAYFIESLGRVGRKAISQADEQQAAVEVIRAVARIGESGARTQAATLIDGLAFSALRQDQDNAVGEAIDALAKMHRDSDEEVRSLIAASFRSLVPRLARDGHQLLLEKVADHVAEIAEDEAPGSVGRSRSLDLLEAVGREAALNRLVRVVRSVGVVMADAGKRYARNDTESARAIALGLLRVERAVDRSDADAIAALGFARNEVEALLGESQGASGLEDGESRGFSDLWDERET